MRKLSVFIAAFVMLMAMPVTVLAAPTANGNPDKWDTDHNGYPDAGVFVTGHYTSVYAYDSTGNYYWDLGDGRVYKTVNSITYNTSKIYPQWFVPG